MRFASLGSGSRGNGTLVHSGDTLLLIDCGFSLKETEARLTRLGVSGADIAAILVTHEHTDHCSGVGKLSRRYDIPVYMTRGTWASERCQDVAQVEYFHSEAPFTIGTITVAPIAVPHDAREPCQFVLQGRDKILGVLTDLGSVPPAVINHYRNCQALILECNHDSEMLEAGPYPPSLQQRVGGDWGHLNNHQAARLLTEMPDDQLQHLVIAHLSEKNNCRDRVTLALAAVYAQIDSVVWADQVEGFEWLELA